MRQTLEQSLIRSGTLPCFARLHTWWRDRPVGPLLWLTVALLMPTACRIPRTEPASSDGSHTATIEDGAADYRGVPTLAIADASGREVDGILRFIVSRNGAVEDPVTVAYSTEDGTAVADDDYHPASGTLTIPAESTAAQVDVALIDDALPEGPETFTLRISDPTAAPMSAATGTGTILANDGYNDGDDGDDEVWPLELASLQVTGAGTLYPPFAGDILHYALTCPRSATVQVSAQALHNSAKLTLLRADTSANVVAAGTLNERLAVNHNHDIAIKLRGHQRHQHVRRPLLARYIPEDQHTHTALEQQWRLAVGDSAVVHGNQRGDVHGAVGRQRRASVPPSA